MTQLHLDLIQVLHERDCRHLCREPTPNPASARLAGRPCCTGRGGADRRSNPRRGQRARAQGRQEERRCLRVASADLVSIGCLSTLRRSISSRSFAIFSLSRVVLASGTVGPWRLRRPPPARRTCPFGSGWASRSCLPRLIVERASPVIFETITRPPRPAVRTSAAANRRRPRSSSRAPTASHRSRMAASSIMRTTYPVRRKPESPTPESIRRRIDGLRFTYCSEWPKCALPAFSRPLFR
jgi:hypothetical protein